MPFITIWDLILTPIYLGILVALAQRTLKKNYPVGHKLRKYYLPGLYIKFAGAIFIGLVYQFYYGGGDTSRYFEYSNIVNSSLSDSINTWIKLILRTDPSNDIRIYQYANQMEYYRDPASYAVVAITAIFGLITFNTYLPTALLFAYISFTGIWAMFKTFASIYPTLVKPLAFAFLFVPSVFVWGSGIFKDTICIFGLGWMTYTTFRIFINRDFSIKNMFLLVFSFYLVAIIKIYILLAFLPALVLWLLTSYSHKIRIGAFRFLLKIGAFAVVIIAFQFFAAEFSKELNRYSLESITETLERTRGWIVYASGDEGSAYNLGEFDPSLTGILKKFPEGVAVTLFRPFLWEAKKPIIFLSAIEAFAFLILTIYAFYKNNPFKTIRLTFQNPNLLFFFTFSMIFAFSVGISTGNFGALSRYKIPCLPFFAAYLVILIYNSHNLNKKLSKKPSMKEPIFETIN